MLQDTIDNDANKILTDAISAIQNEQHEEAEFIEEPLIQEETPEEEIQEPSSVPENQVAEVQIEDDAIDFEDSTPNTSSPQPVIPKEFLDLGQELNIQEKTPAAIATYVKELAKQKNELEVKLSEQNKVFVDERIAQANEIAKNGGDYLEFLNVASVDYTQLTEDDALEYKYSQYFDLSTEEGQEKMWEYIDGKSDIEKEIESREVKMALINDQKQKQANYQRRKVAGNCFGD